MAEPGPTKREAAKVTKPFPFLELPFELLCEVMARIPAGDRHFYRRGSQLATTCTRFRQALKAVSEMPAYREEDAVARRIAGIRWLTEVAAMVDDLANARPDIREWALRSLIPMTCSTSVQDRQKLVANVLQNARKRSALWELEVMRHLARHLPHTDSDTLTRLTELAVKHVPANKEERFARTRVLAQLAQRISPNDVPGSVRRWESIYQLVSTNLAYEDYLTLRGLTAGYDHLCQKFRCKFNLGHPTDILMNILKWKAMVGGEESDPYIAACPAEELAFIPPPEPLPGTVVAPDPLRAYSSIMAKPIRRTDPLPAHLL
ncbi:F-box protein [Cupriavidus gilardii]|uniref:F-box protein n=1 Tax=Cupriavidus gilardii TaxID=82541 RepID=UPI001ABE3914|nr:F-box protein [Cupriavidus gilardii]MBO4123556.1 F-box protein [Cupriavidus gilardii]